MNTATDWLDEVSFNAEGLIPAIAQDASSGAVLMLAWMNRESLALTVAEQRAVYYSRSRAKIWRKGEESGHVQKLKALHLDCDGDTVLLWVEQTGAACHTGKPNCFFRRLEAESGSQPAGWTETDGAKLP